VTATSICCSTGARPQVGCVSDAVWEAKVRRLAIGADDVCPICYDGLAGCDVANLAWCRAGCGGNFHRSCVRAWADARRRDGNAPTCPVCRGSLDAVGVDGGARPPLRRVSVRLSDIMSRAIATDDYELLLRLDRPQNQRIRAANRIIAPIAPRPFVAEVVGRAMRTPADPRPGRWRPPLGRRRATDAGEVGLTVTALAIR
jgi:hypothetical protein